MKKLTIVDENNLPDVYGALLKIGVGCDYGVYFKTDIVAFLSCSNTLFIIKKADGKYLVQNEAYTALFNGNTGALFASSAELAAWVELYLPVTHTVPQSVNTYADLLALMPVNKDTFVTVINDEHNGTGINDNYLYLLHASGVITWVAAQTIN